MTQKKKPSLDLYTLVNRTPWRALQPSFERFSTFSQAEMTKYRQAYNALRKKGAIDLNMTMHIVKLHDAGEEYAFDIYFADAEEPNVEGGVSLDLYPWEFWLGAEISPEVRERFTDEDIIMRSLLMMTEFGFTAAEKREYLAKIGRDAAEYGWFPEVTEEREVTPC